MSGEDVRGVSHAHCLGSNLGSLGRAFFLFRRSVFLSWFDIVFFWNDLLGDLAWHRLCLIHLGTLADMERTTPIDFLANDDDDEDFVVLQENNPP